MRWLDLSENMPGVINTRVTLDSNVFISAIKENEEFSKDCREILNQVGISFILYQPTLCITELYNAIGKTKGETSAKKALKEFYKMVYHFEDYGSCTQCERVGKTALKYRVYSADAFYLQTSLDFKTNLISLDEKDFIDRIRTKNCNYNIYHAKDALSDILI